VKVVLDTNVLISGIFFSGPPFEILSAWRDGIIQFVLSSEIIDEYVRVAGMLADEFPGVEVNPILNLVVTQSEIIQPIPLPSQICEDRDDDKFLACALAGDSKIIISGDKHLLKLSGYEGLIIVTPSAFVNQHLE
jgi:putative PIN family toxin of toxin-antitoxin system